MTKKNISFKDFISHLITDDLCQRCGSVHDESHAIRIMAKAGELMADNSPTPESYFDMVYVYDEHTCYCIGFSSDKQIPSPSLSKERDEEELIKIAEFLLDTCQVVFIFKFYPCFCHGLASYFVEPYKIDDEVPTTEMTQWRRDIYNIFNPVIWNTLQ